VRIRAPFRPPHEQTPAGVLGDNQYSGSYAHQTKNFPMFCK
jgi:hypothetical protein